MKRFLKWFKKDAGDRHTCMECGNQIYGNFCRDCALDKLLAGKYR